MATTDERGRRLRGAVVADQSRLSRRIALIWKDRAGTDTLAALLVVAIGLGTTALFGLAGTVGPGARQSLSFGALTVLSGVTALILAAVTFGWTLRLRHLRPLNSPGGRSKLKKTWKSVLVGTASGLVVLGLAWAADVAFGWAWTGWVSLGAVVFVVARTARALWLLTELIGLAE
jgi:hypothetical protein